MSVSRSALTEDEQRLLKAAVDHARGYPREPNLAVRRVPFGFETNLTEYAKNLVAEEEKARWESALKSLLDSGFLSRVHAGGQTWEYAVSEKALEAFPE